MMALDSIFADPSQKCMRQDMPLEAYFPPEAATLIVQFDSQPTNRAGMNGLDACSRVLDSPTVAAIQGTASSPPRRACEKTAS